MKKQTLKNKEIDRIGDKVLNAVRMTDNEIDRIVAAPGLFDRINAASKGGAQSDRVLAEPVGAQRVRPPFYSLYALRWQSAAVFSALILISAGIIGLIESMNQSRLEFDVASITKKSASIEFPSTGNAFPVISSSITPPTEITETTKPHKIAQQQSLRVIQTVKAGSVVRYPRLEREEEMGDFQAITFTGDTGEKDPDAQIVRVQLSRASLYAMGVDVPAENEGGKIKADLLIDFDGVMRAVRLEKKVLEK